MERHYIFKLLSGYWVQCSGWYSCYEECEEDIAVYREDEPDDEFTIMTHSGALI